MTTECAYEVVVLEPYEVALGAAVGMRRHLSAMFRGLVDRFGYNGDGWSDHIEGACAEMAVAKFLGHYWSGSVDTFHASSDVGTDIEVRLRSSHDYDLLVRPGDPDGAMFWHVTGKTPNFRVHGCIQGRYAKREEWLHDYGGRPVAYFVPCSALYPADEARE